MEVWVRLILMSLLPAAILAQAAVAFNGSKWNISTGNLSVSFIQASPIGAYPRPGYLEPPPPVETLVKMKEQGLVAYEDYIAWGAIEREPGKWDWTQHDRVREAVKKAGLHYVVYDWVHFPPVWLRESGKATLMRCVEHHQDTNYLSIFDPKTIEYYDRFYKALFRHFGDRIDGVYACILGPYGEGNYPHRCPQRRVGDEPAQFSAGRPSEGDRRRPQALSRRFQVLARPPQVARLHHLVPPGHHRLRGAVRQDHAEVFPAREGPNQAGGQRPRSEPDSVGHLLPGLREDGGALRDRPPAGGLHGRLLR